MEKKEKSKFTIFFNIYTMCVSPIYYGCSPPPPFQVLTVPLSVLMRRFSLNLLCFPVCPPGQPVFRCFANPCQVSSCPAYIVTSNCKANYCGGCNAVYFDQHNIEIPSHRCNCQPDQSAVECLVDPCRNATCAAQPDAKCRARRCDSCVAEFVALNGTIITKC